MSECHFSQSLPAISSKLRDFFGIANAASCKLQDPDVLKIIMRSIFKQYSKNNAQDISTKQQIEALNKLVLDYAIPQVYGSAQGYMKYKRGCQHVKNG